MGELGLFYGYVGLLILAGAWGIFLARVDASLLFDLDLDQLASTTEASLLSQYRFLRALELGFGLWAMLHRHAIHHRADANRLFLSIMAAGVAARLISLALDGSPSAPMYFFLVSEPAVSLHHLVDGDLGHGLGFMARLLRVGAAPRGRPHPYREQHRPDRYRGTVRSGCASAAAIAR